MEIRHQLKTSPDGQPCIVVESGHNADHDFKDIVFTLSGERKPILHQTLQNKCEQSYCPIAVNDVILHTEWDDEKSIALSFYQVESISDGVAISVFTGCMRMRLPFPFP